MKTIAALAALILAGPAAAQVVPDEFPDPAESVADRVRKDFVERYRPFLSGLYSEGTLAAGPVVGSPLAYGSATLEGGYRFDSGDSVGLLTSVQTPLGLNPVSGEVSGDLTGFLGAQVGLALRRVAPEAAWARRAELGVGAGAAFYGGTVATSVHLAPRVAVPLTPTLSMPLGVRVSQEIGGAVGRGPFVGLSVGLRRIWADEARMVLE